MENQTQTQGQTEHQEKFAVTSFYSFIRIENPELLIPQILLAAKRKYVRGTVLVAHEGVNGSISGSEEGVKFVLEHIKSLIKPVDFSEKTNYCNAQPFSRIKVKIKAEIVALRFGDIDVNKLKGKYIDPENWDEFISRDDVITIDNRNDYEIKAGTFKKAIDPNNKTFREFPDWVKANMGNWEGKKVAMFCTGGIRCEKSTALLTQLGVKDVYHLKGGILQYLEDTKNKNNMWQGSCFVFDDRGAVDADLSPSEGFWVPKGMTAKKVSYSKD